MNLRKYFVVKIKKIDVQYITQYIPIALYSVLLFLIVYQAIPVYDDITRLGILNQNHGVRGALDNYYHTWGGRLFPTLVWLLSYKVRLLMWKILNVACFAVLMLMLSRISQMGTIGRRNEKLVKNMIGCALFFLIPLSTMLGSVVWITGSFYYFWAGTSLLIALIPFFNLVFARETKNPFYILYVVCALYACYCEQTAVILIFSGVVALVFLVRRRFKSSLLSNLMFGGYYLVIAVNALICLTAPGSKGRVVNETLFWFPDYDMLSIPDKLFRGLCLTANYFLNTSVWAILLISILVILLYRKKFQSKGATIFAALPLLMLLINLLPLDTLLSRMVDPSFKLAATVQKYLTNFSIFDYTAVYSKKSYIGIVAAVAMLLLLAYLIYTSFDNKRQGLFCLFLLLSSIGSGLMMGFSPTIYASGNRVFFISDLMMLVVAMCLVHEFFVKVRTSRIFTIMCVGLVTISGLVWLAYFTQIKDIIYH
ncbi:MAG: DUF6056 family protein [Ethanoligenens sp.]